MEKNKSIWQKEIMERFQNTDNVKEVYLEGESILVTQSGVNRKISWHSSLYGKIENSFSKNAKLFVYTITVEKDKKSMYIVEFSEGEIQYLFTLIKLSSESKYEIYEKKTKDEKFMKTSPLHFPEAIKKILIEKTEAIRKAYQALPENRLRHLFSEKNR